MARFIPQRPSIFLLLASCYQERRGAPRPDHWARKELCLPLIGMLSVVFLYGSLGLTLFCAPVATILYLNTKTRCWAPTLFLVPAGAAMAGTLLLSALDVTVLTLRPELMWSVTCQGIFGAVISIAMVAGGFGGLYLARRLRKCNPYVFPLTIVGILFLLLIESPPTQVKVNPRGATLRNLRTIRSALELYKLDHRTYPPNLSALPVFQKGLPIVHLHRPSSLVKNLPSGMVDGAGGWIYVNEAKSPDFGKVMINSRDSDNRGIPWSSY